MNPEPSAPDALVSVTAALEQQLTEARKEKTFVQIPALRRLNFICRLYFVVGIIGLVMSAVFVAPLIRMSVNTVKILRTIPLAALYYAFEGIVIFPVMVCWRFNRQFKRNDTAGIADTATLLVRLCQISLVVSCALFLVGIYLSVESDVTIAYGTMGVGSGVCAFYIRIWVKAAKEELPTFAANQTRYQKNQGYPTWTRLYVLCLITTFPVLAASYIYLPAYPDSSGNITRSIQAQTAPASVPALGAPWIWELDQGWTDIPEKPATFTLLKMHAAKKDELVCGLIVGPGSALTLAEIGENVRRAVNQSGQDYKFIGKTSVESSGKSWEQFEFTMTVSALPLHYIYRIYSESNRSYTLTGWALENDFSDYRTDFVRVFDAFTLK